MATTPGPKQHELLPPLIACLPTAFVSPKPPPALLPLLSPILRQRLSLLSNAGAPADGGWLSLLSWDPARASKLASKVEVMQLEAHPVSGELELQEVENIQYRRLDQETLHVRLAVDEFELLPIYLWCDSDEQAGGPGWRLTELRALEDMEDGTKWFDSEVEATQAAQRTITLSNGASEALNHTASQENDEDDDDDDYWASYDRTPGRTPKRSPAPNQKPISAQKSASDEQDYYSRYSTVQPAMDAHDPDEEVPEQQSSSQPRKAFFNGMPILQNSDTSSSAQQPDTQHAHPEPPTIRPDSVPTQRALYPADDAPSKAIDSAISSNSHLPGLSAIPHAPRPTSPASSASDRSIAALERGAADITRAEMGIKQHISSEVKNLFRLARSVGIDRAEFERIVSTQVDVLGMMEEEDD